MPANHDRAADVQPTTGEPRSPLLRKIPPLIVQAQNAYCRDKPQLRRDRLGQWVAYHGDKQVGFSKDYTELLEECIRRGIPEDEYVLYCIEEECDLEPIDPRTLEEPCQDAG